MFVSKGLLGGGGEGEGTQDMYDIMRLHGLGIKA